MFVVFLLAGALAAALGYQALGNYLDRRRFPAPGRLIDIHSGRLHLYQQGDNGPVVVMEAGLAASSLSWALVQSKLGESSRACAYDRAGFGWSSPAHRTNTLQHTVGALRAALRNAGLPSPYILVGHSFGGLLIRAFAHIYRDEVSGLILVDPVSIDYWSNCSAQERKRLAMGARLSRRGAWLAQIGVVRAALALLLSGGRRLPRLVARASAPQAAGLMANLAAEVKKLPPSTWPIIRAHWSRPKAFVAMAATLEALAPYASEAANMSVAPEIPIVILSAASATDGELAERDRWAAASLDGRHIRTVGTGHWIHLEQPDLVVDAVKLIMQKGAANSPDLGKVG